MSETIEDPTKASHTGTRNRRKWTDQEVQIFQDLMKRYDKDYKAYLPYLEGRTYSQVKSHYHNKSIKEPRSKIQEKMRMGHDKYSRPEHGGHAEPSSHRQMSTSVLEDLFQSTNEPSYQLYPYTEQFNSDYENLNQYIRFGR